MSVQAITEALEIQGVTPAEKLLLIVLANYADREMKCWPSHSTLASDTSMSERNILRVFKTLEAKGLLSRRGRKRGDLKISDVITLTLSGDTTSPRGDILVKTVGTPCRVSGDTMAVEPSENLKEEPSARTDPRPPRGSGAGLSPEERKQRQTDMLELVATLKSRSHDPPSRGARA